MAGIYLHIPFCKQACTYCNFHFSTSLRLKDDLLQALLRELELQRDYLEGAPVETIYLGGGTPSLLSADELNRLFEAIYRTFPADGVKECTLEANPDDLTTAYLKSLRQTPVDRLSIGIQSFRESDLRYMNRAHSAQQSDYAIKAAQDAGYANMSIDLIYGTPGLSDADWQHNLKQLALLQIPHFSAYALTVEEGTALDHAIRHRKAEPVDPARAAAQMELLMDEAALMGYEHYEISNFARPHCYAVHNTAYWQGVPYLGLGPSAHSFNGRERRWNVASNPGYIKSLLTDGVIPFESETLTQVQQLNEYIMTSLRTMWGTSLKKVEEAWGSGARQQLVQESAAFQEQGMLLLQEDTLILTPKGKRYADRIAGELFFEE